jgi:hypothetical protein
MSRADKLYQRLNALEAEYRRIAARDLGRMLRGGYPWVIGRTLWNSFGKAYRRPEQQDFEQMEKEIISLRAKLDEPLVGSPVHVLRMIGRRYRESCQHSEHVRPLIRSVLDEWKKQVARERIIS